MDGPKLELFGYSLDFYFTVASAYYLAYYYEELTFVLTMFLPLAVILIMLKTYFLRGSETVMDTPEWIKKLTDKEVEISPENDRIRMEYDYFEDTIRITQDSLEALTEEEVAALVKHEEGHSKIEKYIFSTEILLMLIYPFACYLSLIYFPLSAFSVAIPLLIFKFNSNLITYVSEAYADLYSIRNGYREPLESAMDLDNVKKKIGLVIFLVNGYPCQGQRKIWFDIFTSD